VCKETTSLTIHTRLNRSQGSLCSDRSWECARRNKKNRFAYLFKPISVHYKIEKHKSQPHTSAFVSLHDLIGSQPNTIQRWCQPHPGSDQPQAPGSNATASHLSLHIFINSTSLRITSPFSSLSTVTYICNRSHRSSHLWGKNPSSQSSNPTYSSPHFSDVRPQARRSAVKPRHAVNDR
jgi:hypothetical protein